LLSTFKGSVASEKTSNLHKTSTEMSMKITSMHQSPRQYWMKVYGRACWFLIYNKFAVGILASAEKLHKNKYFLSLQEATNFQSTYS